MKKKIHPKYIDCTVTCGCGEKFTTRATRPAITVEICSKCHPFYTGKQKFVDSAGQVEKFQKKFGWSESTAKEVETRKTAAKAPKMQKQVKHTLRSVPEDEPAEPQKKGPRGKGRGKAPADKKAAPPAKKDTPPAKKDAPPAKKDAPAEKKEAPAS